MILVNIDFYLVFSLFVFCLGIVDGIVSCLKSFVCLLMSCLKDLIGKYIFGLNSDNKVI